MARNNWTREELIKALELYCVIPFGRIHKGNPAIISLANVIGRTPSSVGLKLANFAAIDPTLDRKGLSSHSKLDKQIWNEFFNDVSSVLLGNRANPQNIQYVYIQPEALEVRQDIGVDRVTRVRLRQQFFRKTILEDYESKCCITDLPVEKLLVASHIKPWAEDESNRVNPHNGLLLNALHDKAFDRGLITIDQDNRVVVSQELKHREPKAANYISNTEGKVIRLPTRFKPKQEFLEYHRNNIFVA